MSTEEKKISTVDTGKEGRVKIMAQYKKKIAALEKFKVENGNCVKEKEA